MKALGYLAKTSSQTPIQISEIATAENISHKFLESILLELKKNGLLGAKKGKGGGYYLLKPASEIPLVSVFRILEGPIAWLPCVSLNYYEKCEDCESEEACALHVVMLKVRDNILDILENQSLADLK